MKKRIFALLLVLTLAVSLSACGNAVTPEAAVGEILAFLAAPGTATAGDGAE